jgi:FkbM family methyltransferase
MTDDTRSLPLRVASRIKWLPWRIVTRVERARQKDVAQEDLDAFLGDARGVIHVGAHKGQERHLYAEHDLDVVWVEPIPDVYAALCANLAEYPRQRAVRALVTDKDDREYTFHVSSNNGGSSSIFELGQHREIWPEITYVETLQLRSVALATLIEREAIALDAYDTLVLDTQGSELLVLHGAESLLPAFRYIKVEVADFEVYRGCCQLADIERFVTRHGFRRHSRAAFATQAGLGSCYDVVYERRP